VSGHRSYEAILAAVERYYEGTFASHGASPRGVDWNSAESQLLRFEQLASLFRDDPGPFAVNDLGCGYGAFASFCRERGYAASYTGYELSSAMLDEARARFRDQPGVRFREGTALVAADYSVASGIFNVRLDFSDREWSEYVDDTIARLARASRKGFAFNMLTSYSDADRQRPDLFYADPREVFDACKTRYSRNVALLHDYGLWEFTIIVRLIHEQP
jgi:SAM-dependent methyltransferase